MTAHREVRFRAPSRGFRRAPWPSGKAEDCKSFIPGSNPGGASKTDGLVAEGHGPVFSYGPSPGFSERSSRRTEVRQNRRFDWRREGVGPSASPPTAERAEGQSGRRLLDRRANPGGAGFRLLHSFPGRLGVFAIRPDLPHCATVSVGRLRRVRPWRAIAYGHESFRGAQSGAEPPLARALHLVQ